MTGSTGKTSTRDILTAVLARIGRRTRSARTGTPRSACRSRSSRPRAETEALALEMAMRGEGQIAELAEIAEPDVGPNRERGARAPRAAGHRRARGRRQGRADPRSSPGRVYVVPTTSRCSISISATTSKGSDSVPGATSRCESFEERAGSRPRRAVELELPVRPAVQRDNTLAAVAAATALGVRPGGQVDVEFSSLRGEVVELAGGVKVVNDCYNANPMSMRAALDHLADTSAERRLAVLGTMAELGQTRRASTARSATRRPPWASMCSSRWAKSRSPTRELRRRDCTGGHPRGGRRAAREIALPGDRVLVKGSRSVGPRKSPRARCSAKSSSAAWPRC